MGRPAGEQGIGSRELRNGESAGRVHGLSMHHEGSLNAKPKEIGGDGRKLAEIASHK